MASSLVEQVKATHHLSLSTDYVERCLASRPNSSAADLYKKALTENIKDVCDASVLPFGIASQTSATLPNDVVLQIHTSRDATQPLRPCADATEEEAALNAALQKSNHKRLLRLVLTDGFVEIPAFELTTLNIFRGVPIPGEKLLVRAGTEVKNGAIIMTEKGIVPLGGEVSQLKMEFLAHRRRMEAGYQISGGLEGAPKFQPIGAITANAAFGDRSAAFSNAPPHRGGAGGGSGYRGGRGGGGYRGGGHRGHGRGRGGGHYDPEGGATGNGGHRGRGGGGGGRGRGRGGHHHSNHYQGDGGGGRGVGGGYGGRGRGRGYGAQEQ